jgi:hypothetical protein
VDAMLLFKRIRYNNKLNIYINEINPIREILQGFVYFEEVSNILILEQILIIVIL